MNDLTMTIPARPRSRGRKRLLMLPALGLALACGVGLSVRGDQAAPAREITLVARDMAFYLPDDPTPNPRITLHRGEHIRLTLRNEDRGMDHDFAVDGPRPLDRATKLIPSGASDRIDFVAPDRSGEFDYLCSLHPQMMRGVVEVL